MKYFIYISLFILVLSCKSRTKFKEPDNLISKEQMIDLLVDLHIGTSSRDVKNINLEKNKNYIGLVFEKYKIDSTQFANSNIYYMSNIVEYENMFKEVEKQLETLRYKYNIEKDTIEEKIRRERKKNKKNGRGILVE